MRKINIFGNLDMSEEAVNKRLFKIFEDAQVNPENMSYWLPKIEASVTKNHSTLKVPETKIISLDFEKWRWLRSDKYTPEKIKEFNDFLVTQLNDFLPGEMLFMKTGIFSNKFEFNHTVIDDKESIGQKLLEIFYTSMIVGADNTSEVVFRKMIVDKEERQKIYNGMPLHTEFRIFYDFETKDVVGVANYWHPEVMEGALSPEDTENYTREKQNIVSDFNTYKQEVAKQVQAFMQGCCSDLAGKWSIDVMKNGNDFWLIDMARMEKSALVKQIESIGNV